MGPGARGNLGALSADLGVVLWSSVVGALVLAALPLAAAPSEPAASAYDWQLPKGFPRPPVPLDNPMSQAKVTLGCRLFFDTRLSSTRSYSCASCHQPQLAFTDGRPRAIGASGDPVRRSTMTLTNVAYNPAYTWASTSAVSLEMQMQQPLFNDHPLEMGLRQADARWLATLSDAGYTAAFQQAFPGDARPLSADNVVKVIAAFERTLISGRSAFDRYVFDDDRSALSAEAQRGMALFYSKRAGCVNCHFGINFSGPIQQDGRAPVKALFANTGVATFPVQHADPLADSGLSEFTHKAADRGKFRVPTLRNVALTAPYMHDGSIATLQGVIDHYVQGGRDPGNGGGVAIKPVALSAAEQQELIAFLNGLTDAAFIARAGQLARCSEADSVPTAK